MFYDDAQKSVPKRNRFVPWLEKLSEYVEGSLSKNLNGYLPAWKTLISELPKVSSSHTNLATGTVTVGRKEEFEPFQAKQLETRLRTLAPWRKGPFSLFGIHLESEWRSDFKWDRLKNQIDSLQGRTVLDVGCGNGYHCFRMAGEGAELVIGIDPVLRFFFQFLAVRHFISSVPVFMLPVGIEGIPKALDQFDTVFSMGVLYHRRSPVDHLMKLRSLIGKGGQLVLETLVVDGGDRDVLVPSGRYGKMNNVWFIPAPKALELWLTRCGFQDVRLIDITKTTPDEQRKTEWMTFESLTDFLNPNNSEETIEGLPAPKRAIFIARNG